ncbi:MAG: MlaD family protein [Bacteroidales bacterium]|nr:MlaD family protein [Bacteroidales bacterium]
MASTIKKKAIIVGLFLIFGLVILVTGILTIGNLHNSFVKKFMVTTIFDDVNGLQQGNNIWYSGLKIGTVKVLEFCGKSQVKVSMMIDYAAQPYIRNDSKAKISTDGLIGNKIIVIYGGSDTAPFIAEGDTLMIEKTTSTEDMMNTLQANNKNILAITDDFKLISKKIANGEGTLGKLLTNDSLYYNIDQTVTGLNKASRNAEKLTASIADFSSKLNQKGSLTNDIVTDTVVFNTIKEAVLEMKRIATSASELTTNLKKATGDLNSSNSPAGVILHDQSAASDLKSTLKNLEISTQKLNEDLEALQHSFLLKKYFKNKKQ